jgi:hypothetical protein
MSQGSNSDRARAGPDGFGTFGPNESPYRSVFFLNVKVTSCGALLTVTAAAGCGGLPEKSGIISSPERIGQSSYRPDGNNARAACPVSSVRNGKPWPVTKRPKTCGGISVPFTRITKYTFAIGSPDVLCETISIDPIGGGTRSVMSSDRSTGMRANANDPAEGTAKIMPSRCAKRHSACTICALEKFHAFRCREKHVCTGDRCTPRVDDDQCVGVDELFKENFRLIVAVVFL